MKMLISEGHQDIMESSYEYIQMCNTLNMFRKNGFPGFILLSFKKVYAKLNWSREVNRLTSLNQRHENKFDMGVWARTINEPSGTSTNKKNAE